MSGKSRKMVAKANRLASRMHRTCYVDLVNGAPVLQVHGKPHPSKYNGDGTLKETP